MILAAGRPPPATCVRFMQPHGWKCALRSISVSLQLIKWMNTEEMYWIGLSDRKKEGLFVWGSGHALSGHVDKHWSKGQPDDYKGREDCGLIWHNDGRSADIPFLKHACSTLRQSSNPVCGSWKNQASREGSVAASADFYYIFRASADGNPISRFCSREMGLPSAATLEM